MKRIAIFDLDGTLVDTLDDLVAAVASALRSLELPPRSREEVRTFIGGGVRHLIECAIAPRLHLADAALAAWWAHYEAHCLDRSVPYPGIAEVLSRAGRTLAVHTYKPGALARRILTGVGLGACFAAVVGGDEAPQKPDPAGTLAILSRLGGCPSDAVLVGDGCANAEIARSTGIPFVAVTWGLTPRSTLAGAGATLFADHVRDLEPFLA